MLTVKDRIEKSKNWLHFYERFLLLKDKSGKNIYPTIQSMFSKRILSSGIEGKVYKSSFINKTKYKYKQVRSRVGHFVIKALYLKRIRDKKVIHKDMIDTTPANVYNIFYSKSSFDKPSLVEVLSLTLTNQLVSQKICPHFIVNYYWEYKANTIRLYNEYATYGDFKTWAKKQHSVEMWMNAIFQIFIGILAIKRYFNMIHTDLHAGNILVHRVQPGGYWTYIIDKKRYYLPNLGYVFVLSDFGFSWIPKKVCVPWHYDQRLKYLTTRGQHFYDVSIFIKSLQSFDTLPTVIKNNIGSVFQKSDFIVFQKKYYKNQLKNIDKKDHKSTQIYKSIVKHYSTIKHKDKFVDKIHKMFSDFTSKPNNSTRIETYSLDKHFKVSTLHKNFRELVF